MATKKIIVVLDNRNSKELIGTEDGYQKLLHRLGVLFLVDQEGFNVNDFVSLLDGGKYTLGQPQQQQRNVRQRMEDFFIHPEVDDSSEQILNDLRLRKIGEEFIETYASAEACKIMLDANVLEIKVTQDYYDHLSRKLAEESMHIRSFQENAHVSFSLTTDEAEVPKSLLKFFGYFDLGSMSWTGETEDEIHAFVESAVSGPICKFFSQSLRISRNKAMKTSSGRADYSVSAGYTQLFRGEDKMRSLIGKEDPKRELLEKSPKSKQWRVLYGADVPYIFGYYSIGGTNDLLLQFVCIKQDSTGVVAMTKRPFDLTKFSGVFGCRCFMFALMPHLLSLKDKVNVPLGLEWKAKKIGRIGGLWQSWTVQIILDHAREDCALAKDFCYAISQQGDADAQVAKWVGLYSHLPESPHLMKLRRVSQHNLNPESGEGRVRCVFEPLCQPYSVTGSFDDELSARLAVLHVLSALTALHAAGLVHNDVRWANVVRKQGENSYVLVDYDELARVDTNGEVSAIEWMDPASHAPNISSSHDKKVDLWGLCKMMSELECRQGNVSDLLSAGLTWLRAYPQLPGSFHEDIRTICSRSVEGPSSTFYAKSHQSGSAFLAGHKAASINQKGTAT